MYRGLKSQSECNIRYQIFIYGDIKENYKNTKVKHVHIKLVIF